MSETFCQFVRSGRASTLMTNYHDEEYGAPNRDESVLFERLTLETFQAGLSWEIVLKKREGLRDALSGFDVDAVANLSEPAIEVMLQNPAIIRNRRKIEAAKFNAGVIVAMREEFGGFANWLDIEFQLPDSEWVPAFKKRFKFMGGEVVGEFLISLGLIPGSHDPDCKVGQSSHMGTWQVAKVAVPESVGAGRS